MKNSEIAISFYLINAFIKMASSCVLTLIFSSSLFLSSSIVAPSIAKAADADCAHTVDSDQKYTCEASSRKDPSYCNYVTNSDSKSFCMALVNHDPVYCSQIADKTKKIICLASQNNRGQ